jgi:hypothetical protein
LLISTRGRRLLDGEGVRAVQCFPTPSRASSLCLFRPSVGSGDGEGRQARASRTHALAGMSSQSQRGRSRAWFVRHGILPLVFSGCEPHTVPRADASFLLPGHSRSTARLAGGPWAESPTHLKPFFFQATWFILLRPLHSLDCPSRVGTGRAHGVSLGARQ